MEQKELLAAINRPLMEWYQKEKRDLPWREEPQAYSIWISEIMLQQTRVEAVKGYYRRFLHAFPTIEDLANAKEEELLKAWEGLGYYNRVRNMQKAAQKVLAEYGGNLPASYEKLLSLPGIGSYTAGAVASIAYNIQVPAVDGNVLRVIMRILENGADITKASVKKQVEQMLLQSMDKEQPGVYNQALMELGAIVCVPNQAPKCGQCPVSHLCKAYLNGTALSFPVKTPAKQRKIEKRTVFVMLDGDCVILHKRGKKGLLAGLYEFPNIEGWVDEEKALEWVKQEGFSALHIQKLPDAKHIFSHVEWHMQAYRIKVYEAEKEEKGIKKEAYSVIGKETIRKKIAIPSAFLAYQKYISDAG